MKNSRLMLFGVMLLTGIFLVSFLSGCQGQKATKYPGKTIEVVVPFSPGGGTDTMARTIAAMLNEQGIVKQSFTVVNKPGGSSAVGMSYLAEKKGDPYYIMPISPTQLITMANNKSGVSLSNFTPLVGIGEDPVIVLIKFDSPYKDFNEFIAAAKANPEGVKVGGTGAGGSDQMIWMEIAKQAGVKFKYVPFQSGGEVTTALLGGHVDAILNSPNESYSQIQAKQFRVLATTIANRIKQLPDVPTLKELGINFEWGAPRGLAGPANMPEEAVKFWDDAMKQLTSSEKWQKDYIDKYMINGNYMDSQKYQQFLQEKVNFYETKLKELGL